MRTWFAWKWAHFHFLKSRQFYRIWALYGCNWLKLRSQNWHLYGFSLKWYLKQEKRSTSLHFCTKKKTIDRFTFPMYSTYRICSANRLLMRYAFEQMKHSNGLSMECSPRICSVNAGERSNWMEQILQNNNFLSYASLWTAFFGISLRLL